MEPAGSPPPGTPQRTQRPPRPWPPWHAALSNFQTASTRTASAQLLTTLLPYGGLWALMVWSVQRRASYALTLALAVVAALFLVRAFVLFHDCVHDSLFPRKGANSFFGHALGMLVFTPFEDWRFSHLRHHATYADLDARGFGDIWTLTQAEYDASSRLLRWWYRVYRSPLVLVGMGALFSFLLRFRLPTRTSKHKQHVSVVFTNLILLAVALVAARTIGWRTYLLVQLPVIWLAGALGIWLFYVQHQFQGGYWAHRMEWDPLRAAMEGSSHYALPAVLRWFSANIGYHHLHHLSSRIPNYRLKPCYEAVPELRNKPALTIRQSLAGMRLKLWDEARQELVGFPHGGDNRGG